jgi:hypothetical protein
MRIILLAGFNLNFNLNSIVTTHIVGYSLRKQIFKQVLDNGDMMKHLSIDVNRFDVFYTSVFLLSIFFYINDLQYKNSFNKLKNNINLKPLIKKIELVLLILFFLLTKDVDNAT